MEETIRLLKDAKHEIESLRIQNKTMKIRLDMFDDCMALLTAHLHAPSQGMSPDLVCAIEKHLKEVLK